MTNTSESVRFTTNHNDIGTLEFQQNRLYVHVPPMFQLPPLARAEKGWNPTIPALLLYPKRMKCDKKSTKNAPKAQLSQQKQTNGHPNPKPAPQMSDSRKHNPNNQFGRIEHIATQNHTSRDRLEKQIRNALQTNPMRPILKKNEIRRTTFPRTQSQAFPGISL